MPYLVIAFGLVLSCFGGLAMVNGSSIIQIERGWSLFIGGAALLSGGVVTMAVGIALKAVLDRVAAFAPPALASMAGAALPIGLSNQSLSVPPPSNAEQRVSFEPRGEEPQPIATARHDPNEGRDVAAEIAHDVGTPAAALRPLPEGVGASEETRQFSRPSQSADPIPLLSEDLQPGSGDSEAREGLAAPLASFDPAKGSRARDRLLRKPSRPLSVEDDLDGPTEGAEEVRDSGRSLDAGRASLVAPRKGAIPERVPPVETIVLPERAAPVRSVEPVAEPIPTSADLAATEPSVIGRYESEGTSYVMYSDGSIEAQSAAGIYRFASMAELKSFIES